MTTAMNHAAIRPFLVDQPLEEMGQDGGGGHAQNQMIGLPTRIIVGVAGGKPKACRDRDEQVFIGDPGQEASGPLYRRACVPRHRPRHPAVEFRRTDMPARHHRFHLIETSCGGPAVARTWPPGTVGGAGASPRPAAAGGSAWVEHRRGLNVPMIGRFNAWAVCTSAAVCACDRPRQLATGSDVGGHVNAPKLIAGFGLAAPLKSRLQHGAGPRCRAACGNLVEQHPLSRAGARSRPFLEGT